MKPRDDSAACGVPMISRRGFIQGAGAGAAALGVVAKSAHGETDPGRTGALPETLGIMGAEMLLLLDAKATDGRLSVLVETTPPGGGPPLHDHANEDEYFYVLEGAFEFTVGGEKLRPRRGDFLTVPRGVVHRFENVGSEAGRLHITLSPGGFEEFFRKLSALSVNGRPDPDTLEALGAAHGLTWHR